MSRFTVQRSPDGCFAPALKQDLEDPDDYVEPPERVPWREYPNWRDRWEAMRQEFNRTKETK